MEKDTKINPNTVKTAAPLILAAIFLISSVYLFFAKQDEAAKRAALETRVEELTMERARLSSDLKEITTAKNDLEVKLSGFEERAKQLESQLGDEKKAKESAFTQLETEKRESKKLVEELMRVKDEKEKISSQIAAMESETKNIKTQLSSVQQAKEILEAKLKELLAKKEVELERIVVRPESASEPEASAVPAPAASEPPSPAGGGENNPAKGEILVVNKKFDFVVVNLGEANGIVPGMNLTVYRDSKFLATLQVDKVHATMSAARIPEEWKNVEIKEGDAVVIAK